MDAFLGSLTFIAFPAAGVLLLWMIHLLWAGRQSSSIEPLQAGMTALAWILILTGLFGPMVVSFIGWGLILVAIPILCMALVQFRRNERRALLWMLATSAERRLPLATAARAFAAERSDAVGRSAVRLAELLDAGLPLPDALALSGNRLPTDAAVATRLEYETGGLGAGMLDAAHDASGREAMWRPLFEKSLYFLLLWVIGTIILTFMMIWVAPAFEHIFDDFDTELPPLTQLTITVSHWFARYWYFFALPLLAGLMAMVLGSLYYVGLRWEPAPWTWHALRQTRWLTVFLFRLAQNVVLWPLGKLVGMMTMPFHRATLLKALARTVEAGRPLVKALYVLAASYPQRNIRARLDEAAARVDRGEDWCDAFLSVGLVAAVDAGVLKAAQRVGNLPWAMREMAARQFRRLETTAAVINNVILPLGLLLVAVPIGAFIISMFMPLVTLIHEMTP